MNYVSPDTIFAFIMNSAGAVALFVYLIIAFSQLRLRSRLTKHGAFDSQLKMWFHPWLGIVTIVGICVVLGAMGYLPSTRSQLLLSLLSVGALLLAYPFARRSRERLIASAMPSPFVDSRPNPAHS
jgi:GABA permease